MVASSNLIIFRDSNIDPLKDRSGKDSQGLLHHQQTACTGGGYGIIMTATMIWRCASLVTSDTPNVVATTFSLDGSLTMGLVSERTQKWHGGKLSPFKAVLLMNITRSEILSPCADQ